MGRPPVHDRPTEACLTRLYQTSTDEEIADRFGCSKAVVKGWRRHYGIRGIRRRGHGIGSPRLFSRPSPARLSKLTKLNTDEEIAAIYGCSRSAVRKWRAACGLAKTSIVYRRRPWAHSLDEHFFSKIDTEKKAYILGLLATDGCVANGKSHSNRVFLCLQAKDAHILQEVLQAMRSSSPIHNRPKGSFPGSGPMKYIAVSSRHIVADLAKWGVVPRKSHILTYAKNIPAELERHYVRGLFDGDGTILPKPKRLFAFLGTGALMDGVVDAIYRNTGVRLVKRRSGKLYRVSGYAGSLKVLHWIYRKSTIALERKRTIYEAWT